MDLRTINQEKEKEGDWSLDLKLSFEGFAYFLKQIIQMPTFVCIVPLLEAKRRWFFFFSPTQCFFLKEHVYDTYYKTPKTWNVWLYHWV